MSWWNSRINKSKDWAFEGNDCIEDGKCPEMSRKIKVILSKKTQEQIKTLLRMFPNLEWMGALIGKEVTPKEEYYIENIKIFEQKVNGASVELTDKGNEEKARTLNIGWIHSHNSMGAFLSSTDIMTAKQNIISIVVNNKLEFDGRCKIKVSCLGGKDALLPIEILYQVENDKETEELANALIIREEYKSNYFYEKDDNEADRMVGILFEQCLSCNNQVGKKKKEINVGNRMVGYVHNRCIDEYNKSQENDATCEICYKDVTICSCGVTKTFAEELYDDDGLCLNCKYYYEYCTCQNKDAYNSIILDGRYDW